MTSEEKAIKSAYEDNGMLPEDISIDRDLNVGAVKACLMNVSAKYRKDCGHEPTNEDKLNFSDDDLMDMNRVIKDIALGSDDDNLRFKAATYIRDDKKGRKEVVKNTHNTGINVILINERMAQVRQMADNIKSIGISPKATSSIEA